MDWFLYDRDLRHERVNAALNTFKQISFFLKKKKLILKIS